MAKHLEKNEVQLIGIGEVVRRTSLSRATIYRQVAEHTFPKPVRIGHRRIAFSSEAVQRWIEDKIRGHNDD